MGEGGDLVPAEAHGDVLAWREGVNDKGGQCVMGEGGGKNAWNGDWAAGTKQSKGYKG